MEFEFQIALSFAGEQKAYVDQVAFLLREIKVSVFYHPYQEANTWGKNLADHLHDVYRNKAQYVVIFVSKEYAAKAWPDHERKSAQEKALTLNREYILPARFDDTELPGLHTTMAYVDLRKKTPQELCLLIAAKLRIGGGTSLAEKLNNAVYLSSSGEKPKRGFLHRYLAGPKEKPTSHSLGSFNTTDPRTAEVRDATVLFCELGNFSDYSERLSPSDLTSVLNRYYALAGECFTSHGGHADQFMGDTVMATFGATSHLEDHAMHACRAAASFLEPFRKFSDAIAGEHGARLAIRMGLNSGTVLTSFLGWKEKRPSTVGPTVSFASRAVGANKYFGTHILMGERTANAILGDEFTRRPVARLRVKGRAKAVEVSELVGITRGLDEQSRSFSRIYNVAYRHYVLREFKQALEAFEQADKIRPFDLTTTRLLSETRAYVGNEPPDDWEPILSLDSK